MGEEFLKRIETAAADVTANVLVDTNVMMEIYSIGDLLMLGDTLGSPEAIAASTKHSYRLWRSRHSNLLAWWFAQTARPFGVLGNEVVETLEEKLARKGDGTSYAFTTGIMHVIIPYVLKSQKAGSLLRINQRATGEDADTALLEVAKAGNLPLITWEGFTERGLTDRKPGKKLNLRGRCREAGVLVFTPQEYLEKENVDIANEAERFCNACRAGVDAARAKGVLMDTEAGRDVMDRFVGLYRWLMLGEVSPEYLHLKPAVWPPSEG